jgi:hypothetical protein
LAPFGSTRIGLYHDHVQSGPHAHLCNARTHQTGPDDPDALDAVCHAVTP